MSADHNEAVMRRYLGEVLGQRRFDLIPEFVAPDMIDHTQQLTGPEALDAHARGFCANMPDAKIEIEQVFATDDAAIGIWRWSGTPQHPMGRSEHGNDVYPTRVVSIFEFRDGLLAEYRPYVDAVQVRTQIAAPPSDRTPSEAP